MPVFPSDGSSVSKDTVSEVPERIHSACGVALRINLPHRNEDGSLLRDTAGNVRVDCSHQVVLDGLKTLGKFEYRSGEDDGAGIKINGFTERFFNKKIAEGHYIKDDAVLFAAPLAKGNFVVGQFFLPKSKDEMIAAKLLIEESARESGLELRGFRHLNATVDSSVLTKKGLDTEPSQWQAIFQKIGQDGSYDDSVELERAALNAGVSITARAKKNNIPLHLISLSSKYVVYKGLIHPKKVGQYFRDDLYDEDFTATGTEVHGRYSTNTDSLPENAQPCEDIEHNGELNSAPANAAEMRDEMLAKGFDGVFPDPKLSDSMQFKADLHNLMIMKNIPFIEAFVRLMPPRITEEEIAEGKYSKEVVAMLKCFELERTGYNGPAFMVGDVVKLDESGLRPGRLGIIEDEHGHRQFHASSDDLLVAPPGGKIIKKWELDFGGMVHVTPEGDILETTDILEKVCQRYQAITADYFQKTLDARTTRLHTTPEHEAVARATLDALPTTELNRLLYATGWDKETIDGMLYMALHGAEEVIALGDDTDPLHATIDPPHIAYFFHQLFAQVSSPSLDSTHEPEDFSLETSVGPVLETSVEQPVSFEERTKIILLDEPVMRIGDLEALEHHTDPQVCVHVLDTSFNRKSTSDATPGSLLCEALVNLLQKAEEIARNPKGGVIVLSDRFANHERALIPDVLAVAAVRKHLENKCLIRNVSIVADSYQCAGPHHQAMLKTFGARSIYPRGVYAEIPRLIADMPGKEAAFIGEALVNVLNATLKCLLKNMGKMGLNRVNNYRDFVAALGLDFTRTGEALDAHPTLGNIFGDIYSPMKGVNLDHVANALFRRYEQAYNPTNQFNLMPHSGFYMQEAGGIKHGFGPIVTNAFTEWLKAEEIDATRCRIHRILAHRYGVNDYIEQAQELYSPEHGFLDPLMKDDHGYYPPEYLDRFVPSSAFNKMSSVIEADRRQNPTALIVKPLDRETVRALLRLNDSDPKPLQSQSEIRKLMYEGNMSQGALGVTDPEHPEKLGPHETLTRGMNSIGAMSASGEGGEDPDDLRDPTGLKTTRSKQIASGRFGVSAMQILCAEEIEFKVAQGAKPGEGGQLSKLKVDWRFAAQRGGLPHTDFISPPPHHDTYSIEDLMQIIHDIKEVNPRCKVSVKLVASKGIGTIAVGVAKAGADVINVAGNDGGTGAAQKSSVKHAGMPAKLGISLVDKALRRAGRRHQVKLRMSGGFKTAEDVIIAAILGADLYEFGTTAMMTIGCKNQRTCNKSCEPGITVDSKTKFKGQQINTERFFVNLAASVQARLRELGVNSLDDLKGRTELLDLVDPTLKTRYDLATILDRSGLPEAPSFSLEEQRALRDTKLKASENSKIDALIAKISACFDQNPKATFEIDKENSIELDSEDLSFGARVAGVFAQHLERYPEARIILRTTGIGGQSLGFVKPRGMDIYHLGPVQDGCGKSMTGGVLTITTPQQRDDYRADQNTIAGNVLGFGASGGEFYVNGRAGHRAFVRMQGATAVIEGAGRRAFEFMTSGTGMILGAVGGKICSSATGGIVFVYDKENQVKPSKSVRFATDDERHAYEGVMRQLLQQHVAATGSLKAQEILATFNLTHFKVLIPRAMDKVNTLSGLNDVLKTYRQRTAPITLGMKVWLEVKALEILAQKEAHGLPEERATLNGLLLFQNSKKIVSDLVREDLLKRSFTTLEDAIYFVRLGVERKDGLKAETQQWFDEEVLRLLNEGLKKSSNKETLDLFEALLRHAEMKTLSPHIKAKCLHFIAKEKGANAEDFGLSSAHLDMIRKGPRHVVAQAKPLEVSIHRTARERMKGGLDETLTEALKNIQAYIETLAHNAAGCSTCGAQSCSGGDGVDTGCPGGKNINTINTTLQQLGQINGPLSRAQWAVLRKAFELQIKKTPFIFYTGAACPAPCESACTETIPDLSDPNPKRAGKRVGEETHIKKIELHLDQIGHALGWYDDEKEPGGAKEWTEDEIRSVFGNRRRKEETYNVVIKEYTPAFRPVSERQKKPHLRLDIVGSGPAAMEMARLALLDGVDVHMFEKSNRPGGLLADGIPPHKYDKKRVDAHFRSLEKMGLHLHLNSEVKYDASTGFYVEAEGQIKLINDTTNPNHHLALCVGAGKPKQLRENVIEGLMPEHRQKIVQGVNFLKKASDVTSFFDDNPQLTDDEKRVYIQREMGDMAPFGKKIAVIGGGDTAQDAVRTLARFFNLELDVHKGYLTILVRGPKLVEERGLADSYPKQSKTPTPENRLRFEELDELKELQKHADGDSHYLVEPTRIEVHPATGKLSIHMKQSAFKHQDLIDTDEELKALAENLPREAKPLVQSSMTRIDDVDMVICALGFEGQESIKIIQDTASMERVYIAGDAAYVKPHIIIGAQASAHDTYLNKIRAALGLHDEQPTLARPVGKSPLLSFSLFGQQQSATHGAAAAPSGSAEGARAFYASV